MMGVSSMASVLNVMIQLTNGTTTFARSWPALITSFAMLSSMLVWPTLSRRYNKRKKHKAKNNNDYDRCEYTKNICYFFKIKE